MSKHPAPLSSEKKLCPAICGGSRLSSDQPDLVFSYQITPRTLCTTANIITVTQTQAEIQPYLNTKVADAKN